MKCANCDFDLSETAKFCSECGAKVILKVFCNSCGTEIEPKVKFCPECGLRVTRTASSRHTSLSTNAVFEESKAEDKDGCSAEGIELNYKFYDSMKDGFFACLMKVLEDAPEDLHALIRSNSKDTFKNSFNSGVKGTILAFSTNLEGLISSTSIHNATEEIQQHAADFLAGWGESLDRVEHTGNRVLQEVPSGLSDSLIKSAKIGVKNSVDGAMLAGGIGLFAGIAKSLLDCHQLDKEDKLLIEEYHSAVGTCLEQINTFWEELYDHVHIFLKEKYGIKSLSHTQIQSMYEAFDEKMVAADMYNEDEKYEDALESIDDAIHLCPFETYPYIIKANTLMNLERADELLQTMETLRGIGSAPKDEVLVSYYYSGCAYCLKDDAPRAIDALQKVTQSGMEDAQYYPEANYLLAICHLESGDKKRVLKYLRTAVDAGYDNLEAIEKADCMKSLSGSKEFKSIVETVKNRVAKIVEEYLFDGDEDECLFSTISEFPEEKLQSAKDSYVRVKRGERILAIYDSTVFGGAKEGICFTNRGVYWKNLWEDPVSIKYSTIYDITDEDKLMINGVPFCSDISDLYEVIIAEMLRKICRL